MGRRNPRPKNAGPKWPGDAGPTQTTKPKHTRRDGDCLRIDRACRRCDEAWRNGLCPQANDTGSSAESNHGSFVEIDEHAGDECFGTSTETDGSDDNDERVHYPRR